MTVYAVSGIVLIFRDTTFLKQDKSITKSVKPNATAEELGQLLGIRQLKVEKDSAGIFYFKEGTYDQKTGSAKYIVKELPLLLDRMTHLHKAKSSDPLFFLNIFFGASLFFFVISAFWMFMPGTPVFRKGMYFAAGGIILVLLLLLI